MDHHTAPYETPMAISAKPPLPELLPSPQIDLNPNKEEEEM
jgi:hypothetical protein